MAEGQTGLNIQVADAGFWGNPDCATAIDGGAMSLQPTVAERDRRRDDVRRAVEADIVPRIVTAHDQRLPLVAQTVTAARNGLEGAEVLQFVGLLLGQDDDKVAEQVARVRGRGVALADIYLQLFQPAARHIGDLWADDRCSFVDVTLAIGTMQRLLRLFEPIFQRNGRAAEGERHALLVPLPGDQHTFGLSMVTEFFRRAGWSVWNTPLSSFHDLGEAVKGAWFALVGFSASTDSRLDELAAAIRLVRLQSCNRAVAVMVGGPIFVSNPDLVARVGADAMGQDANDALFWADRIVASAIVA